MAGREEGVDAAEVAEVEGMVSTWPRLSAAAFGRWAGRRRARPLR
ncbi:hypothetical protein [Amycolatopsis sp. NPDC051903]